MSVNNYTTYSGDLVSNFRTAWTSGSLINASIGYTYSSFLLSTAVVTDTSSATDSVTYAYDNDRLMNAAGNLTITRPTTSPLISQTTIGNVNEYFTYDPTYGELSQYQVKYSATEIYKEVYTRDKLGRILTKALTSGGVTTTYTYTYDSAGRLHLFYTNGTLTRTYNYDNNSNRLSVVAGSTTSGTYDNQDRILTYGTYSFSHDMNGYRTGRTQSGSVETFTYSYNSLGALTQVVRHWNNAGTITNDTYTYLNDAVGNRIEVKKNSVLQNRYLYDERGRLVAELNSSGNLLSRFVYATMDHVPDYMIKSGVQYKLVHDQLGSVRRVVNTSTGAVASSIDYDEFGQVTASTSPTFQPFGFAGGITDPVTGFVRFKARDYDPLAGRWLSKDPILFGGRDSNLYGYVIADPVNAVDPSGRLSPAQWSGVIGGGVGGAAYGGYVGGPWAAGIGFFLGATFGGVTAPYVDSLIPPAWSTPLPPPRSEPPSLPPMFNPQPNQMRSCN